MDPHDSDQFGMLQLTEVGLPINLDSHKWLDRSQPQVALHGRLVEVRHYLTDDGEKRTRLVVETFAGARTAVEMVDGNLANLVPPAPDVPPFAVHLTATRLPRDDRRSEEPATRIGIRSWVPTPGMPGLLGTNGRHR